ncbi:FGGY family carbohydrate kinase [Luteolibacter flavescens]|uniref:FGGY family carbohydrate kinase n=1 Tax=Luteolibacter flavescens TaxID=1859460 RepID=A0ABT3FUX0_9BACT|nr:FGGY family carbohydrate kinase [Luteolibacter flavescens]MCW1887388.1 FGGY family carbohydrate kinase [Luteolibacter flavescens]
MFLGLDSSTQSLSALVIDPARGEIVREVSVNFGAELPAYHSPSGFIPGGKGGEVHADPRMWMEALDLVFAKLTDGFDLSRITAVACSGQQHGSVYFDATLEQRLATLDAGVPVVDQLSPALTRATAPIWMDTSTGAECAEIAAAAGGNAEVCRLSGSIAIERFTGPQIRRFHKLDPASYEKTAVIHLVSSFVGSVLAGKSIAIDHGDGAGMNLLNLQTLDWDDALLDATAPDLRAKLPPAAASATIAGPVSAYFVEKYGLSGNCQVVLSTGDNPSSLVGMGATAPGTIVISLGTSDTFFAAMENAVTDPQGFGHVFGNPAGGFMSLICFRNGSLAREALRDELGLDWSAFDSAGLAGTPAGNDGKRMLPFYGPEITPRRDFDGPVRNFPADASAPVQVRALLEGQFLNMRLHSLWIGEKAELIRLTGGASQSNGIAQLIADVFQAPVERFAIANGAGLGAALRAAHACGHDLAKLQADFCKPAAGSRLEPDASLAAVYDEALADYRAML